MVNWSYHILVKKQYIGLPVICFSSSFGADNQQLDTLGFKRHFDWRGKLIPYYLEVKLKTSRYQLSEV